MGIKMMVYDPPLPDLPFLAVVLDLETGRVLLARAAPTLAQGEAVLIDLARQLEAEPTEAGVAIILASQGDAAA